MKFKARPLRSVMYVPGNKEDWMRKAPQYGADALILDLADVLLKFFEHKAGMEIGKICIDPALETAPGIHQAYEIAMASERVAHLGGSGGKGGDTARSIGSQWTPEGMETLFIKSKVLVDARAAGVQFPLSGGWFDIRDLNGLRSLAKQLKQLGYTGMHLIHPSHVPVVNEVFTPH
jgi:citrate lyase subunit beta / citryl-CoA lyase